MACEHAQADTPSMISVTDLMISVGQSPLAAAGAVDQSRVGTEILQRRHGDCKVGKVVSHWSSCLHWNNILLRHCLDVVLGWLSKLLLLVHHVHVLIVHRHDLRIDETWRRCLAGIRLHRCYRMDFLRLLSKLLLLLRLRRVRIRMHHDRLWRVLELCTGSIWRGTLVLHRNELRLPQSTGL